MVADIPYLELDLGRHPHRGTPVGATLGYLLGQESSSLDAAVSATAGGDVLGRAHGDVADGLR